MMPKIYRDKLQRVIRLNDVVVWGNKKYGKGLDICRIVGFLDQNLKIYNLTTGKVTRASSENLVVITSQIQSNIADNVGANIDLESTR